MAPFGPVAPTGLANRPLPKLPMEFDTGEGQRIRVTAFVTGLENPWTVAWLPDGAMLVTERPGRLRIVRNGKLDPTPVAGAPATRNIGDLGAEPGAVHGYMDVVLHPNFASNQLRLPRLHQAARREAADHRDRARALERLRRSWTPRTSSWAPRATAWPALAFGRDGMLYVTTAGTGGAGRQQPRRQGAAPARTTAPSRPTTRSSARPATSPRSTRSAIAARLVWPSIPAPARCGSNENGPNGGDEINILKPGANYGWPLVSYGRTYPGPWQVGDGPAMRASSRRWCYGSRRSPSRA